MSLPSYLLIHTTKIERKIKSEEKDRLGKPIEVYDTINAEAKGLIQPTKGEVIVNKVGKKIIATHYGYYQAEEDIQEEDKVTFNEATYIVISAQDEAGQGNHYRVLLRSLER